MAYAILGKVYGDTFQTVLAAENVGKAYALRNHASERERFFITVNLPCPGNGKPGTSVPRQFIEIDPDFPPGPANAAWSYIFVDGLPEAEAVLQKAVARKLEVPDLFLLSYYVAFLKGDQAAMERAAAAA